MNRFVTLAPATVTRIEAVRTPRAERGILQLQIAFPEAKDFATSGIVRPAT